MLAVQAPACVACFALKTAQVSLVLLKIIGHLQVVGVGSVATILQANIEACGSIIHIISNALLPFNVRTLNLPAVTPLTPITGNSPASMLPTAMAG